MRVLLLAFVVAVGLCGQAGGKTLITPQFGGAFPYQRWVDQAKVPTPDVTLNVVEGPCPGGQLVCSSLPDQRVNFAPGPTATRTNFLRTLSYFYLASLTETGKQRLALALGVVPYSSGWASRIAVVYGNCALGFKRTPPVCWLL